MAQGKPRNLDSSSSRFSYMGTSSNNPTIHITANQMQSFESNSELFNLTTGMEMLGFPSKDIQQHQQRDGTSALWKGSSSSKTISGHPTDFYHQLEFSKPDLSTGLSEETSESLMVAPEPGWQENRLMVDDSSLRCVLPCEVNERPSQGLSLSLSSSKPSSIGLQYIESNSRDGFFEKSAGFQEQDGFLGKAVTNIHQTQTHHFELRNSKYLVPAQELLNEFCNLRIKQTDPLKQKTQKTNQWEEENSSRKQSVYTPDLLELQKRKSKLISMLEEVDRRYRQYCDRMKAVVSSFEAVAGVGAATVYSASASKAMSRHFRCLRDGILGQIIATRKAIGEKDPVAPGTTTGETPRLRLLDQTLRQQRAFQQISMMESHPWRPQRGLPERSVSVLRAWLFEHFLHPYPSDVDKHILARQTGLSRSQVSNWFINARVRLWKPMVEEIYLEETKEELPDNNVNGGSSPDGVTVGLQNKNSQQEDQKPTADQLVRGNSDSLSSIISNPDKEEDSRKHHRQQQQQQQQQQLQQQQQQHFGRSVAEAFGVVDLDFSSYNHQTASTSYANDGVRHNFGNGVSLTLGLQQHAGNGVSLSFSPTSQNSLFFPRDHLEDCQSVQYSILEGEGQNLPYRNLMEAQLLHDLAG